MSRQSARTVLTHAPHKAFASAPARVLITDALGAEDLVEAAAELRVAVMDKQLKG